MKNQPRGMIAPGSHGDASTDSALDTFAVKSRGRNGATSMETQHGSNDLGLHVVDGSNDLGLHVVEPSGNKRWLQIEITIILTVCCSSQRVFFVHKMSTFHIHIRGPDCIQTFPSWLL